MVATGTAVGAVNGLVYVYGRLPHPFIVTLATLSVARGLALWLSGGQPLQGMPQIVQDLGGGSLGWFPYLGIPRRWARAARAAADYPDGMGPMDLRSRWQPRRAPGGPAIPVKRVLVSVYVLSGLAAGIGAVITSGRLNGGSPTFGELAELDTIAAVVIGGASFLGGRGTVGNALIGALMIGVIRNGMNLLNVDAFLQPIVIGVVIVLAVELDVVRGGIEQRLRVLQAARVMTTDVSPPALRRHRRHQALRRRARTGRRRPLGRPRRGARPARRQRSRQVHAHQVLSGVHRLDAGTIEMDGQAVDIASPAAARAHGHRDRLPGPRAVRQSRPGGQLLRRSRSRRARAGCHAACESCAAGEMARRDRGGA